MKVQRPWRLAACIALPLISIGILSIGACHDLNGPSKTDAWAEQSLVTMRIRSELAVRSGSETRRTSGTHEGTLLVFPAVPDGGARFSRQGNGRSIRVRHFKDPRGRTHSIGAVYEGDGRPPKFIYAFEEGRIRAVVGGEYRRHGKGWVRERSRVTLFDSLGKPLVQVDSRPDASASTAPVNVRRSTLVAARDAVAQFVLPRDLHAEETEEACFRQLLDYWAATGALMLASEVLTGVAPACLTTGVGCLAAGATFTAWLTALAKWNETLDKLVLCSELAKDATGSGSTSGTGSTSGGGGTSGGTSDTGSTTKPPPDLEEVVFEFIETAIDNGNWWCDEDRCVFYAAS